MRLSRWWRKLLLTVHVVAGVGWLGTELVLLALGLAGARGADPRTVYPAGHLVGLWLVMPLAGLSLTSGLLQGLLTPWGLLRHWWVATKLTLTLVMTGLVVLVLLPKLGAAADAAAGPAAHPLGDVDQVQLVIAPSVASTLLLVNVVLSVYKPGGRLRSRPAG